MPDRETVITHLQIIHTWAEFARERDLQFFTEKHLEDIAQWADDAIVLLKEQESKTGHWNGFPNNGVYDYRCSECGLILTLGMPYSKFCPGCGAKMEGR